MAAGQSPQRVRNFTEPDGVALRDYLEAKLDAQRCYFESRIGGLEKATEIASRALADRLAGMNEIRESMRDQSGRLATRDEVNASIDKLRIQLDLKADRIDGELDDLKQFRDRLDGKASQQSVVMATGLGIVGMLIGIAGLILHILTM